MRPYCGNQKPFIYAIFSNQDKELALPALQKINEDGVSFWFTEKVSKREKKRIEAAHSCVLFLTKNAIADEKISRFLEYVEKFNKKFLCVYLESADLTPGMALQLNSIQSINKSDFADERFFLEKLKSAEIFADMGITPAQKRFARQRALASIFVPIAAAAVLFFAVVYPLFIAAPPPPAPTDGVLQKLGFGNLSKEELENMQELHVVGTQVYDQYVYSEYQDDNRGGNIKVISPQNLTLPQGDIDDISQLALMKNARELDLEGNQITDITPLYTITSLENLSLNCNPIESIEGIEALQKLRGIWLTSTNVSDITPLFKIPSLEVINIMASPVSGIEGIQNLKNLRVLQIGRTKNLKDISPLGQMDFTYVNAFPDGDGFSFNADFSDIEDFSPLKGIPKFGEINAWETKPIGRLLSAIANKPVYRLTIGGTDLHDAGQLSTIKNLRFLNIAFCGELFSIDGIEVHSELTEIEMKGNDRVEDLSPLLGLASLQRVTISTNMKETADEQLTGAKFEIVYQD